MPKSLTSSIQIPRCTPAKVGLVSVPPLAAVLSDVMSTFFGLCVHTGRQVVAAMMEADRVALYGPRDQPDPNRRAVPGGHTRSWVTLSGRRVAIRRPRARSLAGEQLALPSLRWAAEPDPLDEATLAAIAAGVSSRRYRTTLDPLPACEEQRSVSRSAVSRRFVALSAARLAKWLSCSLAELDIVAVLLDGIHLRDRVVLAALGIDARGEKRVLGLRGGSTENATAVRAPSLPISSSGGLPPSSRALR